MYAYLARDLEVLDAPPAKDEDEDIAVVELSPAELTEMARFGLDFDSKSITCFWRAQLFLAAENAAFASRNKP
jgi:hypothetical protein